MRDREQERSAALDGSNRDLYNRTTQLEEEVLVHSYLQLTSIVILDSSNSPGKTASCQDLV